MVEQKSGPVEPAVLAIDRSWQKPSETNGGVAVQPAPAARIVRRSSKEIYAGKANRIVIKHHVGRTIAAIEIISPGNKDSRSALRNFVEKTIEFLQKGIHVLVVDVFPPTPRDPHGIHKAIWDEIEEEPFDFPEAKDRVLVSYQAGREKTAYIEPIAVGDLLPDMPLFLTSDMNVMVPLESSYQTAWDLTPPEIQEIVETGVLPNPED
jgi:hypothetical protein